MKNIELILHKLLPLESTISNFYNYIMDYEIMGDINNPDCKKINSLLKLSLEEETKIFLSLSKEEKEKLKLLIDENFDEISTKYHSLLSKNTFSEYIMLRILDRLEEANYKYRITVANIMHPTRNIEKIEKSIKLLSKEIDIEANNIFHSFLDEEIDNEIDYEERKKLINYKYTKTFLSKDYEENEVVGRNFYTERSIQLCSAMMADLLEISHQNLQNLKSTRALEDLQNLTKELTSKREPNKTNKKIAVLKFRTALTMVSEDIFNEIKFLGLETTFPEDINNVYKERERHTKVSLVKIKEKN